MLGKTVPSDLALDVRQQTMFILTKWRRNRTKSRPFPSEWRNIIIKNIPYYSILKSEDKKELEDHIKVFLEEKKYFGCGGLKLNDEIKITISAQACILLLHRNTDYYRKLSSILVYPSAFLSKNSYADEFGVVTEGASANLGESWATGAIVLSWDDVLCGAADIKDGKNLAFHEFAHQLDVEDARYNGAPILDRRSKYISWARVLGKEYKRLQERARKGRKTLLDKYGATDPAEFFAVATECFFEKPKQMLKKHPELYDELKGYYKQDPATYF